MAPLLIELLTEELPPRALVRLADAFQSVIVSQLSQAGLLAETGHRSPVRTYATPRRLAVVVPDVLARGPAREIRVKGPSVAVGLDAQGQPTIALRRWADKQGAAVDALTRESDGKQDCFFWHSQVPGAALAESIQAVIGEALARLPIPKLMSYQLGDGATTVQFVRPAHRLTVLHGDTVLPCRVLGLDADRLTEGHRFQSTGVVAIDSPGAYEALLRSHRVIASFDERRAVIADSLAGESTALGAHLAVGPEEEEQVAALLDEVTALVEWPAVYVGRFDAAYLDVPQECLILSMRTNQKYFPLFDASGRLRNHFLIVSNMAIDDPSAIIDGNERVVRPRLADARFFFDQDRRQSLADRLPKLADVVYQARLGSQADRSGRVESLATGIANRLGLDPAPAARAARLAKADLLTGMVGEFPELQGIMGRYYARHDGESEEVATAIAAQYRPRFAGDALPETPTGTVLALADKLETLAGIWGVGQRPTGDRDPFALRRHALGVVRMLVESALPLPLGSLLEAAFDAFAGHPGLAGPSGAGRPAPGPAGAKPFDRDVAGLSTFVVDRLRGYLRERGFEGADIDAVLAVDAERLDRVEPRLAALAEFRRLPDFDALAAANKRIANILRKSAVDPDAPAGCPVAPERFVEPAEIALHRALEAATPVVEANLARLDFSAGLRSLATLRAPVDAFFDTVMVNSPDPLLKSNRLALLGGLALQMNRVADLSRL